MEPVTCNKILTGMQALNPMFEIFLGGFITQPVHSHNLNMLRIADETCVKVSMFTKGTDIKEMLRVPWLI